MCGVWLTSSRFHIQCVESFSKCLFLWGKQSQILDLMVIVLSTAVESKLLYFFTYFCLKTIVFCHNNTRAQTHVCGLNILLFMYIFSNQQLDFLCRYDWNQSYGDLLDLKWCWKLLAFWFQCITAIAVRLSKFFGSHMLLNPCFLWPRSHLGFQIFLHTLWIV